MNTSLLVCLDGVWNQTLFGNRDYPIFTNCFQYVILLITPIVFFVPFMTYLLTKFIKMQGLQLDTLHKFDSLHIIKLILPIFSVIFLILEMSFELMKNNKNDLLLPISFSALCISLIFASFAIEIRRFSNTSVDALLFVFWWIVNGCYLFRAYGNSCKVVQRSQTFEKVNLIISVIIMVLLISSLILDCISRYSNEYENPERKSSVLSQITLTWMDRYIYRWFKNEMINENVYKLDREETSMINIAKIENIFWSQSKKSEISESKENLLSNKSENIGKCKLSGMMLFSSLFHANSSIFLKSWLLKMFRDVIIYILFPVIMKFLLWYIRQKENYDIWLGIFIAFVFLGLGLIGSICENYSFSLLAKISVRIRGALIGMIYKKTLRLSNESREVYSAGDIVNMAAVNTEQIIAFIDASWIVITFPVIMTLLALLLYQELGVAMFVGLTMAILEVPINVAFFNVTKICYMAEKKWLNKRINILTEVLNGIKVIKMYTWETFFKSKISKIRDEEIKCIHKSMTARCVVPILWEVMPILMIYSSFTFYIYLTPSAVLHAENVFVSLVLFYFLQYPSYHSSLGVIFGMRAFVSFDHIEKFLLATEKGDSESDDQICSLIDHKLPISINNGCFAWSNEGKVFLNNINLQIEKKKLVAIVGRVGVGKSSLLSAILGEMYKLSGSIKIQGTLALVPQQPWIQNKSLKDNILFTKSYNKSLYEKIIKICCLDYDISLFPMGDETEIGENGVDLSGGQKQRICLARAIYQDSDIYVMDGPLSAVDAHVGKQLFNKVLSNEGILKDKTRILVTHGVKWLPFVDEIIVINDKGEISERGTYEKLLECGKEFKTVLEEHLQNVEKNSVKNILYEEHHGLEESCESEIEECEIECRTNKTIIDDAMWKENEREEEIMNGRVRWKTLIWYFKVRGFGLLSLSFLACIINGILQAVEIVLLRDLANSQNSHNKSDQRNNEENSKYYINFYGIVVAVHILIVMLYWIGSKCNSLKGSRKIHEILLDSVLKATLSFFNVTPSGRILHRFTTDLSTIDHEIYLNIGYIPIRAISILVALIMIAIITPWFAIVGVIILVIYFLLEEVYITSSRQAKRLESKSSSLILTLIMETCKGYSVIRSFGAEKDFQDIQHYYIDKSNKFKLIQLYALRWFCLRLDILGNIITFSAVLFAVINRSNLDPSIVGSSVFFSIRVILIINYLMKQFGEFETNSVAIERIRDYTMIPSEPRWDSDTPLVENWVYEGNVSFENFSAKYCRRNPLVLKNITLNILGGEKIGVVGRTGAGKSSFTLALFRLIEGCDGRICIDGIDIKSVGLHELRKQLTILPQDPIIFSENIKHNLDPFDEHSKKRLEKCLEISGLQNWVNSLPEGMDYDCGEMGKNLSMGQKQLVCLARTLAKNSKIIILDEATASVDEETDRTVMAAVRSQFVQSTVFIIAHRISTIMDCDKILVLENGSVVEFGPPKELLSNPLGLFRSMFNHESKQ